MSENSLITYYRKGCAYVKMIGVYMIYQMNTGKVYIGSSKRIEKRWKEHKRELNNNKHHNRYLQRAWNKYGGESFLFDVIEECNLDILIEREQFWMDYLNCLNSSYGYNISEKASTYCVSGDKNWMRKNKGSFYGENSNFYGRKHTEESKAKMRAKCNNKGENNPMYGKHHTDESKEKIRKSKEKYVGENHPNFGKKGALSTNHKEIICLTTNRTFVSIKEASIFYNIPDTNIINCCKHRYTYAGKFNGEKMVWMYLDEYNKIKENENNGNE